MDFESGNQNGNSKERRDQLKKEIEKLAKDLPFKFEKTSQLRILKAICTFIKKEKHFNEFKKISKAQNFNDLKISYNDEYVDQICSGFMTCFTKTGDLVYLSENIADYFGFNAMDVLFAYDNVLEIVCRQDVGFYTNLFKNYQQYAYPKRFSSYTSWYVSKIQKKHIFISEYKQFKISGHYDPLTELFIASCEPVLSINNRDTLTTTNPCCFRTTHKLNLQILECSQSFYDTLGYEPNDVQERFNFYNLWSHDSIETVVKRHRDLLVVKNTRGYIDRVKLISKDGGYVDCLLNIFYDPKGFIVCIHQIFNKSDMDNYVSYMTKLDRKEDKEVKNEIFDETQLESTDFGNNSENSFEKSLNSQEQFSEIKIENSFENDFLELSQTNFGGIKHKYDYISGDDEDQFDLKKARFTNENSKDQNLMYIPNDLKDIQGIFYIEESLKQTVIQNQRTNENIFEYPNLDNNFNFESCFFNQESANNGRYYETCDQEDNILESCELENYKKFGYLAREYANEFDEKCFMMEKTNPSIVEFNNYQGFYTPKNSFY